MKLQKCTFIIGATVLLLAAAWGFHSGMSSAHSSTDLSEANSRVARPRAIAAHGGLPLSFEVNRGQADAQVRFLARGQGYTLFLTSQQAVLSLRNSEGGSRKREELGNPGSEFAAGFKPQGAHRTTNTVLQMQLVGANSNARVNGAEELPGKSNYFIGNDPKKWRTNIPTYAKVQIEDIYPGVDLVYYGNQGQLEYDFVVRPGADPNAIKLALASAPSSKGNGSPASRDSAEISSVKIDENGDLVVQADGGDVRFRKPVIYQPASTGKRQGTTEKTLIAGHYAINERREVAFAIGDFDRTRPLVIDPVLAYSTYLGGSGSNKNAFYPTGDEGHGIAVDTSGNAYVTGFTTSPDFPITPLAFQLINHDTVGFCSNVFVSKISGDGSALVYSTYLGGSGTNTPGIATGDQGYGIAVDASGDAYVSGITASPDFPVTPNAFQTTNNNQHGSNAFVTKLDNSGSTLIYSSYLGGSSNDGASGIAVDSSGDAYVAGSTLSTNFPVTPNAFQATNHGGLSISSAFVTKINAAGSALVYSTYLGGTGRSFYGDFATGIAVDTSGNAYATGVAASTDFPTANPFQATNHSAFTNAFVTKINTAGSGLVYSTYLGGSGGTAFYAGEGDAGNAIAVDGSGSAYVTGRTLSTDFPTTLGAFQGSKNTGADAFVTKLSADGSVLVYSTYLGSNGSDGGTGIAVLDPGFAYVTGSTSGADFPTANPIQATNHGQDDTFVAELTQDGSALIYSTYFGGNLSDSGSAIAVNVSGDAYVTGYTFSTDFPTANPLQPTNRNKYGQRNAFVAKIGASADLSITSLAPPAVPSGSLITYVVEVTNGGPNAASNVSVQDPIPTGATFNSVFVSAGSCTAPVPGGTGTVICGVPTLASGAVIRVTLVVNVTAPSTSTITDTATTSSATVDPSTANNSATATTTVI